MAKSNAASIRKIGGIVFYAVTIIVFLAGTVFTAMHRYQSDKPMISKENILAIAAGAFLTVGEIAFVFLHSLLDSRDLWRRMVAYTLSLMLIGTITYATYTEASAFMTEGNVAMKSHAIGDLSTTQQKNATTRSEKTAAVYASQKNLKQMLDETAMPNFQPFAINFLVGLFCIITATLIQPREGWKRRQGNVMTPEIRAQAEHQLGRTIPHGATAYEDGKRSSVIVKHGRDYLTTVSKKKIGF